MDAAAIAAAVKAEIERQQANVNYDNLSVEQLQAVSTRDVYLSPPALLFGPGCFLEARVLLPRASAPGAPEAPPKLRVVEVVPA